MNWSRLQPLVACLCSKMLLESVKGMYIEQREEGELLCGKGHFWPCALFQHDLFNCSVRRTKLMQKSSGDYESP